MAGGKLVKVSDNKPVKSGPPKMHRYSKAYVARNNRIQKVQLEKTKLIPKIPRNAFGNGRSKFLAMKYTLEDAFDTGVGPSAGVNYAQRSFRLNSINLPYIGQASGNPLPQGHNSIQNNYHYYKVYACKYRIECSGADNDCRIGAMIATSADTQDMGGSTTVEQLEPKVGTTYKSLSATGSSRCVIQGYRSIRSIEGLSKEQFNADLSNYQAPITASVATATTNEITATAGHLPMRHPKLHMCICPNTTTQTTCRWKVDIIYYVKVFGRETIPMTQSTA